MSDYIIEQIFNGAFPVYSYMYTLRRFMRINGIGSTEVDEFVRSVAGKKLSLRSIEVLADGYFKGSDALREQIRNGQITWAFRQLKQRHAPEGLSQMESAMLRDLEVLLNHMQRVGAKIRNPKFKTGAFFAQAGLLTGGILRQMDSFSEAIRLLDDRSGQT